MPSHEVLPDKTADVWIAPQSGLHPADCARYGDLSDKKQPTSDESGLAMTDYMTVSIFVQ